jgi:hypothetical protein
MHKIIIKDTSWVYAPTVLKRWNQVVYNKVGLQCDERRNLFANIKYNNNYNNIIYLFIFLIIMSTISKVDLFLNED